MSAPADIKVDAKLSLEELHDWRPEENAFGDTFRNYEDSKRQDIVQQTYRKMHVNQTVAFGKLQRENWLKFDKGEFTVMEMIALLDNLVDDSDPDNDLPNSIHDFQTAERIRKQWPDHDWFPQAVLAQANCPNFLAQTPQLVLCAVRCKTMSAPADIKLDAKISLEELHDWRPEENAFGDAFRNYEDSKRQDVVQQTYRAMHVNQTVAFGKLQRENWLKFDKGEFTVMEMIALLDNLVDDSDPDNDLPNSIHDFQTAERIRKQWPDHDWFHLVGLLHDIGKVLAHSDGDDALLDNLVDDSDPDNDLPNSIHDFQTAERIRQQWPDHDWFHLVGLLHDIGKVLALPEVAGDQVLEQWAVVGDTFPVGCAPSEACVFGRESFEGNPDLLHPTYATVDGMYQPGCGISALMMSWGHDEYMYWALKENGCTIPEEGLAMIRYHSFYPWHDKGAFRQFEAEGDADIKAWVKEFNKFDLYSKGDEIPDVAALKPYYQSLLEKYNIGGKLRW
eukprot:CAMPEP_0198615298 /NCGR_PEP_ID=MMETSP1462-20131121/159321_1 /TAXON_ID=1333877 /ORGANISM="Brandtodinium nutriculum, Strain RCC3387" /LENGTH=504 /DNA_ID=CAMNT_0044347097 /DNA_START=59 /DNA_END=1575 /DNA_ORIENTATION=-